MSSTSVENEKPFWNFTPGVVHWSATKAWAGSSGNCGKQDADIWPGSISNESRADREKWTHHATIVGQPTRVAADRGILVTGDANRVAKVSVPRRAELVVLDHAAVRARSRAVVHAPRKSADCDADLDHRVLGLNAVPRDRCADEGTREW